MTLEFRGDRAQDEPRGTNVKVVVGAAGFVGFHLCNSLLDSGEEVLAIDNFDTTLYSEETKVQRTALLAEKGLEIQRVERNQVNWLDSVSSSDVIFNLAATAGLKPSWEVPSTYIQNNTMLVAQILEGMAQRAIKPTIVHASTSSVYGENATGNVNGSLSPNSPYGVSKLAAEQLLLNFSVHRDLKVRILRLFSVFGEHQRPDQFFSIAIKKLSAGVPIQIFGDGQNRRTNVFIDDAVRAFTLAQEGDERLVIADISGTEPISVLQIVEELSKLLGVTPVLEFIEGRAGDQRYTEGDLDSTYASLGWKPEVRFTAGLKRLVQHFQDHPDLY
jgi:UDP-glucose 4-epimerase